MTHLSDAYQDCHANPEALKTILDQPMKAVISTLLCVLLGPQLLAGFETCQLELICSVVREKGAPVLRIKSLKR